MARDEQGLRKEELGGEPRGSQVESRREIWQESDQGMLQGEGDGYWQKTNTRALLNY